MRTFLDAHRAEAPVRDREKRAFETSDEAFDRVEFALAAIDRLRPRQVTVVVCEGPWLSVESGRAWGRAPGSRWAMVAVPPNASRRAIAMAIASLGGTRPDAYAFDLLLRGDT
jgi:hypothetical protein